ncbi:MAG: hypothetical protein V4598_14000 [Bdellovibrionota bacterium]
MQRLRVFFALILCLLFFPFWRGLDYQVFILDSRILFTISFVLSSLFFILIPLHLAKRNIKKFIYPLILLILGIFAYSGSTLSGQATRHYELRHCGVSTFTGFFYHVRNFLPPAHQDDLEVRNQLCWIRKMITKMPQEIDDVNELKNYLELIRQKLLSPTSKFKASLPLIAFLHGKMSASLEGPALQSIEIGKMFVDALHFWKTQYTVEISALEYPWYAWPHSAFIKWEYGLIERNWESLVENIQIETN